MAGPSGTGPEAPWLPRAKRMAQRRLQREVKAKIPAIMKPNSEEVCSSTCFFSPFRLTLHVDKPVGKIWLDINGGVAKVSWVSWFRFWTGEAHTWRCSQTEA
jgi:hypothetical protein